MLRSCHLRHLPALGAALFGVGCYLSFPPGEAFRADAGRGNPADAGRDAGPEERTCAPASLGVLAGETGTSLGEAALGPDAALAYRAESCGRVDVVALNGGPRVIGVQSLPGPGCRTRFALGESRLFVTQSGAPGVTFWRVGASQADFVQLGIAGTARTGAVAEREGVLAISGVAAADSSSGVESIVFLDGEGTGGGLPELGALRQTGIEDLAFGSVVPLLAVVRTGGPMDSELLVVDASLPDRPRLRSVLPFPPALAPERPRVTVVGEEAVIVSERALRVDLGDPENPVVIGELPLGAGATDAVTLDDGLVLIAAAGLEVWDFAVEGDPVRLARVNIEDGPLSIDARAGRAVLTSETALHVYDLGCTGS